MERKDSRTPEQIKGHDGTCETVRVKSDAEGHNGFMVINRHDFDPGVHELFEEEEQQEDTGTDGEERSRSRSSRKGK